MISSDGSDSKIDIDDLEQTDSASRQLSALTVTAMTQVLQLKRSNGCTLNTSKIGFLAKDRTKCENIEVFFRIEGQATSLARANRKRSLTRYANRILDGPLSAFELLVDNSMFTRVQQSTKVKAHRGKNSDKWKLPLIELKAFIFFLYVRGA